MAKKGQGVAGGIRAREVEIKRGREERKGIFEFVKCLSTFIL